MSHYKKQTRDTKVKGCYYFEYVCDKKQILQYVMVLNLGLDIPASVLGSLSPGIKRCGF